MTLHSSRAARALAHLGETDPALAVLALWCTHRDGPDATHTRGSTITYGPGFDTRPLAEQVGTVAHHVLHVALRHSGRAAHLSQRLGDRFDPDLFALAADGIVNEVLALAGHALPRPAVLLTEVLAQAGITSPSAVSALAAWDADRLAMALHSDDGRAKRLSDWAREKGLAPDLMADNAANETGTDSQTEWHNRLMHALEAGRKAGTGIGRIGAVLADLTPETVPWEVHLRGLLARALLDRPHPNWRRPSGRWVALTARSTATDGPVPVYEPGTSRLDQRPRIVIGLDTSSSIDRQMLHLLSAEAEGIARRTQAEVHLLAFDTVVHGNMRLDNAGWQALRTQPMRTGGGTDYRDLFACAAALGPSVLVVLTDLQATIPAAPGKFPVIWATPISAPPPPYGTMLRIG